MFTYAEDIKIFSKYSISCFYTSALIYSSFAANEPKVANSLDIKKQFRTFAIINYLRKVNLNENTKNMLSFYCLRE